MTLFKLHFFCFTVWLFWSYSSFGQVPKGERLRVVAAVFLYKSDAFPVCLPQNMRYYRSVKLRLPSIGWTLSSTICSLLLLVYLCDVCSPIVSVPFRSRLRSADNDDVTVPCTRTARYGPRSFRVAAAKIWNVLPPHLKNSSVSREQFKSGLKTWLSVQAYSYEALLRTLFKWRFTNTRFDWLIDTNLMLTFVYLQDVQVFDQWVINGAYELFCRNVCNLCTLPSCFFVNIIFY